MKRLGTNGSETGRDVAFCVRLRGRSPLWPRWATPETKARGCSNRWGSSLLATLIVQPKSTDGSLRKTPRQPKPDIAGRRDLG